MRQSVFVFTDEPRGVAHAREKRIVKNEGARVGDPAGSLFVGDRRNAGVVLAVGVIEKGLRRIFDRFGGDGIVSKFSQNRIERLTNYEKFVIINTKFRNFLKKCEIFTKVRINAEKRGKIDAGREAFRIFSCAFSAGGCKGNGDTYQKRRQLAQFL